MRSKLLVSFLTVFVASCALGQSNPTLQSQAQVRGYAERALNEMNFSVTAVGAVNPLIDTVPIPAALKQDIRCGVIKGIGYPANTTAANVLTLTQACGPVTSNANSILLKAARELRDITSCAALGTTLTIVNQWVQPLLAKMESSTDQAVRYSAITLRAGLAFTIQFSGGSVTCRS